MNNLNYHPYPNDYWQEDGTYEDTVSYGGDVDFQGFEPGHCNTEGYGTAKNEIMDTKEKGWGDGIVSGEGQRNCTGQSYISELSTETEATNSSLSEQKRQDVMAATNVKELLKQVENLPSEKGIQYVMVRTKEAGVFAGHLITPPGESVTLLGATRIWKWAGAASLSQLAMQGTMKPDECKFPLPMLRVQLFGVVEIINITPEAKKSIESVPVWEAVIE